MLDLAIIIVTWNNAEIIGDALNSVIKDLSTADLNYQICVVDNASTDHTVNTIQQSFPEVQLIVSQENLGFSRANNLGMRSFGFDSASGNLSDLPRAVYLLNPDTITHQGATQELYNTLFADEHVGGVGARLTYVDGSFQHSAFRFPDLGQIWTEFFPTPGRLIEGDFNGRYAKTLYETSQPFDVDFTLGATMMLKRQVLLDTGLFDEDFFIYCEEVDWAWRIRKAGWGILCVPQAHVTHLGAQSTSQVRPWSLINLWKSRLHLYQKHYPSWKRNMAYWLVRMGMRYKIYQLDKNSLNYHEIKSAYQTVYDMAQR